MCSASRVYVIGADVHIYIYRYVGIYVCGQKNLNRNFSDRLTFSNIHSRTSRRIYRLALPLRAPEKLSSSKSRIFLYNAHLALFVRMDDTFTQHKCIGKYHHLFSKLELVFQ